MRILVVGGAGYIGFEVCKALRARDHVVYSLDTDNTRSIQLLSAEIRTIVDDVTNVRPGLAVFSMLDAIVNLTGGLDDASIGGDIQAAQLLALPFLRSASSSAKIVHVSTQYVYGQPEYSKERNKCTPMCNYGTMHCMSESALVSDENSVILRMGTVWGPAVFTRWDTWGNHLIKAIKDEEPITIINPKDLICLLDMPNAVKSIIWAVEEAAPSVYNVANWIGYKEDLVLKFVTDGRAITFRNHPGGISVGMNCSKISNAGYIFEEVSLW